MGSRASETAARPVRLPLRSPELPLSPPPYRRFCDIAAHRGRLDGLRLVLSAFVVLARPGQKMTGAAELRRRPDLRPA